MHGGAARCLRDAHDDCSQVIEARSLRAAVARTDRIMAAAMCAYYDISQEGEASIQGARRVASRLLKTTEERPEAKITAFENCTGYVIHHASQIALYRIVPFTRPKQGCDVSQ
tara:strand:+ start:7259 stop:7597 length:339 start_codon:yes stop_codon:yes gene_type:complete